MSLIATDPPGLEPEASDTLEEANPRSHKMRCYASRGSQSEWVRILLGRAPASPAS